MIGKQTVGKPSAATDEVGLAGDGVFEGAFGYGLFAVDVVEGIDGAVEAAEAFVFAEEDLKLVAGCHFNGMESDAAEGVALVLRPDEPVGGGGQAGLYDIFVEVGVSRCGEGEGGTLPVGALEAEIASKSAGFAAVSAHPVADLADGLDQFGAHLSDIGGPVGKRVHVAHFIGHVAGVVQDPGAVLPGHHFMEEAALH